MGKFSHPLKAELLRDRRASERHTLRLVASASTEDLASDVLIHDLSETGVGFETSADLQVGDLLFVDPPFIGATEGRIVWREDAYYDCEFVAPAPKSTLSASLLQSSSAFVNAAPHGVVEEIPIGIRPSLDAISQWHGEFEQTKGANGYLLMGFRQLANGVTMAMVTKTN